MDVYIVFSVKTGSIMAVYTSYDKAAKLWLIGRVNDYEVKRYIVE